MHPPLYARILAWFLLNVVVLALLLYGVLRWQFRDGLQSALGGMANDRLQALGTQWHETLTQLPFQQWGDALNDLGLRHDAQVTLMTVPEAHVAGARVTLPPEVSRLLLDMHPEIAHRLNTRAENRPPPPRHPPPPRDPFDAIIFGEDADPSSARSGPKASVLSTFMLRAGAPQRYYTGIRLPPPDGWEMRDGPLMLIFVTRSVTGGGLFLDVRPWLVGIFGALAFSALLWLPFVRGITTSIRQSMRATEQIARGRFDVRIPVHRSDEIGRLATAINQMAIKLDGLVGGQKRFLGDIAHELCSPIARLEMNLGILEQRLDSTHSERLQNAHDELREMSALVDELLSFAKASLDQDDKPVEPVGLAALIQDVAHAESVPGQQLSVNIPTGLQVQSRGDLLRRALGNVLRNTLLHAPDSPITITATLRNHHVLLSIADHGPGVPEDSLPRLFEPFYRVDVSRDRATGGSGLGLSIVKTSVESCGGTVTAANRPNGGLEILFELQAA
jgi:two-component system sensor histidine kinase CpxA